MGFPFDKILFSPSDIDREQLPVGRAIDQKTYVLGAFNPGFCRLPNGNTLMMVRVAEALIQDRVGDKLQILRYDSAAGTFTVDTHEASQFDYSDPRKYKFIPAEDVFTLTSLSWLLPVELDVDGTSVVQIHYDKMILPQNESQEYGVEDARITKVDEIFYMTTCAVSSSRHSTVLYTSVDGLNYSYQGLILDHQNKDMVLFPEKINGLYHALTRPQGELYFLDPNLKNSPGPGMNIATSPDMLHWRPLAPVLLKPRRDSLLSRKLGSGPTPIRTPDGWLIMFHAVSDEGLVGVYRTVWMLLDLKDPSKIIHESFSIPLMEANPDLIKDLRDAIYLEGVVFTTGVVESDDLFIVASGELDLCCRITHIPRSTFIID
jgi:predicted GH43/DUF377 family glycosyl hydrolase